MGVHLSPRYGQVILVSGYPVLTAVNRPSHRYGGHIELIRFKEYYGMFKGHEHDLIYSLSIYARLSGRFFCKFS